MAYSIDLSGRVALVTGAGRDTSDYDHGLARNDRYDGVGQRHRQDRRHHGDLQRQLEPDADFVEHRLAGQQLQRIENLAGRRVFGPRGTGRFAGPQRDEDRLHDRQQFLEHRPGIAHHRQGEVLASVEASSVPPRQ